MATNRRPNGWMAEGSLLDDVNRRLLAELQEDGRLSLAELGRRVGLSPPAVGERLQRLEQDGVIRGYRAEVDPRALGLSLSAIVRIRPAPGQLRETGFVDARVLDNGYGPELDLPAGIAVLAARAPAA